MIQVYILSRGRANRQLTLAALPAGLKPVVVVPQQDAVAYSAQLQGAGATLLVQPRSIVRIAQKRAWVCQQHFYNGRRTPLMLLDDDLSFYLWDGRRHARPAAKNREWVDLWRLHLQQLFTQYSAVSLGTKAFALPGTVRQNYHMGFAFGFTYEAVQVIKWNRVNFYEDIDYTLQLLRGGHSIAVTYKAVVQQARACAAGGCDGERTQAAMDADLAKLIKLHPGIIERKQATASHPQANTRISWSKAAKQGGLK